MNYIQPRFTPHLFKGKKYTHKNKLINLDMVKSIGISSERSAFGVIYYAVTFDDQTWLFEDKETRDKEYALIRSVVVRGLH